MYHRIESDRTQGQGGEGGIPRVSHLPELFRLQSMPLANIRDGWNRLELTSMLQRALQGATNRQAVNYFFAIKCAPLRRRALCCTVHVNRNSCRHAVSCDVQY